MNLKSIKIVIFLVCILWPLANSRAAEMTADESVFIAENEVIAGNLFAASDTITINGVISGDVIAAAKSITINGRVEGDIIAIAQNININGEIGGNVRIIGNALVINGSVARNINAFGSEVIIGEKARIGWDVIIAATNTQINGVINGALNTYGKQTLIAGKIGKNVTARAYNENQSSGLIVSSGAIINGDLNYTAKNKAEIKTGAEISGQTNYKLPPIKAKNTITIWAWERLFSILSMILIGLIFVFILPKNTQRLIADIKIQPIKLLFIGAMVLLIIPPLALVLTLTIIGIPLAISLIAIWLAGIFFAQTLFAIFLGELIIKNLRQAQTPVFWSLLLGAIIISLLFSLPFIGWIINFLVIGLGLGSILFYVANQFKNI